MIAWLQAPVAASPGQHGAPPPDRDAAARAPTESPWIDLAPSKALSLRLPERRAPRRGHRLAAGLTLAGLYAGFATWTYFAWYRKGCRPEPYECTEFLWGRDGAFAADTYAGGADKLGHTWATLALGRLGTELLYQWGGYRRGTSILVGMGLSELLFAAVEYRDGFTYQFSYWDFTFNTLGALLGAAQGAWPRFDDLVDFRVQYFPSRAYRDRFVADGDVDVAEDYSGQTYLLALHLGALPRLRDARWGRWARYVDLAVGFETRGYKPDPPYAIDPDDPSKQDYPARQTLFVGLTLNAQGVLDGLLRGAPRPRKVLHGLFEVFNVPGTTWRAIGSTRRPSGPTDMDGA
jgi:hypothetical protein